MIFRNFLPKFNNRSSYLADDMNQNTEFRPFQGGGVKCEQKDKRWLVSIVEESLK